MLVALSLLYCSDICIYYFISRSSCRDMACSVRSAHDVCMCVYVYYVDYDDYEECVSSVYSV